MNTDIRIEKNLLVSNDNDMFDLVDSALIIPKQSLSSISCVANICYPDRIWIDFNTLCVEICVDLIKRKVNEYNLWLFSSTYPWEKETKRLKYYKLWGRFKEKYGNLLSKSEYKEESVYANGGVKYFGFIKLQQDEVNIGMDMLKSTNKGSSFLVMFSDSYSIDMYEYIKNGWGFYRYYDQLHFWSTLISYTCRECGVFLRVFGEFDDNIVGVNAIMHKTMFDKYFND